MTPTRQKRLNIILLLLMVVAICGALVVKGLQANMTYFISPSDAKDLTSTPNQNYRIGGTVKTGSIQRLKNGISTKFLVTDCRHDVTVEYTGLLPDLFRDGQGVIADGKINQNGVFVASTVLAKHDENYIPRELASEVMIQQLNSCSEDSTI